MEDVQVVRAVVREERGDERVGHGFERAVGQGEDERAQVEKHVGGVLRLSLGRRKRDEGRQHVEQERRDDQLAVADLVDDDAADDDAEAEAGETGAADGAELRAGEAEVSGPVGQDAAADAEADAGGENGQEAGPQQALGVRCGDFGAYSRIAHGCPLSLWLTAYRLAGERRCCVRPTLWSKSRAQGGRLAAGGARFAGRNTRRLEASWDRRWTLGV